MRPHHNSIDDARIADNLRRTIELTELSLALRASVMKQDNPYDDAMALVMHEIRCAKERAWQESAN